MNEHRRLRRQRTPLPSPAAADPFGTPDEPSAVALQSAGFGATARAALDSCQRGADAQSELDARKQESGQ